MPMAPKLVYCFNWRNKCLVVFFQLPSQVRGFLAIAIGNEKWDEPFGPLKANQLVGLCGSFQFSFSSEHRQVLSRSCLFVVLKGTQEEHRTPFWARIKSRFLLNLLLQEACA